jgi:hypothetical protein
MEKIKLHYEVDVYKEISLEKIKKEIETFRNNKELELKQSKFEKDFEIIIDVYMISKSIQL